MSLPQYPKYKSSGVEWLGEVPEHWEVMSLRRCLLEHRQGYYSDAAYVDSGVKLLRITDIRDFGRIDYAESPHVEGRAELEPFFLRESDFVFARTGGAGTFGLVESMTEPVVYASYLIRFRFTKRTDASFLRHFFLSSSFQDAVRQNIHGGVNQNIHAEDIKNQWVALPPSSEQADIAAFLDRETEKIDALVEEQRRLIELLKEKRQAVISRAVTKGLNPDAPMKDSGIDWLGDIPVHWTVIPTRFVARLESGHTPSRSHPEYWQDCKRLWFTLADIWQIREAGYDVITETSEMVSDLGLANSSARLLPKGTVMLSRTASVGFSAIMGCEMATSQDFANWVCGEGILPEFLLRVFRSMEGEFRKLKFGSTHNTIYMPDIHAFRLALPPVEEQHSIVSYISEQVQRIDELTAEATHAIDLLQERRTALISAAVTGKIDVRGLAAEAAA